MPSLTLSHPTTHTLTDTSPESITLPAGSHIVIETAIHSDRILHLSEGARMRWYGFFASGSTSRTEIRHIGRESRSDIRGMVMAIGRAKCDVRITSTLACDGSTSDMLLASLVRDGGGVRVDGGIDIAAHIRHAEGFLREEHIFLGGGGSVRGIPSLAVGSADVRAGHSMKVERIPEEHAFYLQSRGLKPSAIREIVVGATIERVFGDLREYDEVRYDRFVADIRQTL